MNSSIFRFIRFVYGKQSDNTLPRFWVLLFDMVIVVAAYFIAMLMLYLSEYQNSNWNYDLSRIVLVPFLYLIAFLIFRPYEGLVRYSGFNDIQKIITSCTTALLVLVGGKWLFDHVFDGFASMIFPRYFILVYHYFITIVVLVISRLTIRRFYNEFFKNPKVEKKPTLVYGAGEGGLIIYRVLSEDNNSQYKIFAFIDDNKKKINKKINTIGVVSPEKALNIEYIKMHRIKTLILAIPSLDIKKRTEIVDKAMSLGLEVKTIPNFAMLMEGDINSQQIVDIKIDDLLGRDPIKLDNVNVKREIEGKVVMITGAAGSIGSEICRQVLHYDPKRVIMVDQAESPLYDFQFELKNTEVFKPLIDRMVFVIANVKDKRRMEAIFGAYKPQVIYHAAAYKHVPFMEENPYEAVYVNVFGTKNVADLAMQYGAEKFVMVSTDKAVNPTNVMGATKRIAEMYVQSRNSKTNFVTTRFGNVLGSNGSVVPLFRKQLQSGGPLTVTDKRIIRYFMTIPEACSLVMEAGSIGEDDDIFVFDMGQPVRIWDLADKMRQLSHRPEVEIKEIGLRPGEKLYEELLATKENTIPTENPKIMRAKVEKYGEHDMDDKLVNLQEKLSTSDPYQIVAQMKAIVPEFISNNSIFEKLDKHE